MDEGVEDLRPTAHTAAARTWDWRTFACAWTSMIMQPGSISGGASLLSLGLSVAEATCAHLLGGVVLWVFLTLSAWPGVKYGIPFPVVCRSAFGVLGAHFCTLSRGAVAIMWLSFQMWQATLGLHIALGRVLGEGYLRWARLDPALTLGQLLILLAFVGAHGAAIVFGVRRFRRLVHVVAPVQMCGFVAIIVWLSSLCPLSVAIATADTEVSQAQSLNSPFAGSKPLGWLMAINVSVGTWSALVLNVCDLSRFAPSQRDQSLGQALGLPLPFAATGFVGLWAAGATEATSGVASWQIPQYFETWAALPALCGGLVLALAILAVNVLANLLSPTNDLLNLAPDRLSFRGCGFACLALSVLACPWWLFESQQTFVLRFLGGYTSVTGAIAGVLLTDFWVVRRGVLHCSALYAPSLFLRSPAGSRGRATSRLDALGSDVNWRALAAVVVACLPVAPGFAASLSNGRRDGDAGTVAMAAYSLSWFVTLTLSSATYWCLTTLFPRRGMQEQRLLYGCGPAQSAAAAASAPADLPSESGAARPSHPSAAAAAGVPSPEVGLVGASNEDDIDERARAKARADYR